MEGLCRICRNLCIQNSIPIASDHDGVPLKEILIKTCPIDLTSDDPISLLLPQFICNECLEIVSAAYNLQRICVESDKYFRSTISDHEITIKTEKFEDEISIKEEDLEVQDEMEFELDMMVDKSTFKVPEPEYITYLVPVSRKRKTVAPKNPKPKYLKMNNIEKPTLYCDFCGASSDDKNEMENHILDGHLNTKKKSVSSKSFNCTICGLKFLKKGNLNAHIVSRHGQVSEYYKRKTRLRDPKVDVYEKLFRVVDEHEIEISLKCCLCEENHETEVELIKHLHSHRDLFTSDRIKCFLCTTALQTFQKFLDHAIYHAQPQTHECLTCKKRYPFGDRFKKHLRSHQIVKIPCKLCPQKFTTKKFLQIHEKIKHNNEKLFICSECGYSFANSGGLNRHVKQAHKDKATEGQFKCKSCPRTFEIPSMLKMHEVIHSKERLHVCEICGSSFKLRSGLTMHIARLHDPNAKITFDCHLCDRKFTLKSRLKQHMLQHTGEKPHKCNFCEQAYRCKGDLVKHMERLHTPGGIYQCGKCLKRFRLLMELREHQIEHVDQ